MEDTFESAKEFEKEFDSDFFKPLEENVLLYPLKMDNKTIKAGTFISCKINQQLLVMRVQKLLQINQNFVKVIMYGKYTNLSDEKKPNRKRDIFYEALFKNGVHWRAENKQDGKLSISTAKEIEILKQILKNEMFSHSKQFGAS